MQTIRLIMISNDCFMCIIAFCCQLRFYTHSHFILLYVAENQCFVSFCKFCDMQVDYMFHFLEPFFVCVLAFFQRLLTVMYS